MGKKPLPAAKLFVIEDNVLVIKFLDENGNYYPIWIGDIQSKELIKGVLKPGELQVRSKNNDDPIVFIMETFYEIDIDEMNPNQKCLYEIHPEKTKEAISKRGSLLLQNCKVSLNPEEPSFKADIIITRREPGLFDIEIDEERMKCCG